jgi:predicted RNA-binding Zn ribbon-like protein
MASRRKKTTDEPRELATSGALCLAFANSGAPVPDARRLVPLVAARFDRYADVVAWIRRMGAASAAEAERLLAAAAKEAAEAAAAAARARTLRGALVRIFTAESAGKRARAADLKTLNDALVPALAARRLVAAERGCGWTWEDGGGLDRALWPVALSAAELLTSADVSRVRQCADRKCPRLFVDRGRSQPRLWCDMRACGNRAKNRRLYRRHRDSGHPLGWRYQSPVAPKPDR